MWPFISITFLTSIWKFFKIANELGFHKRIDKKLNGLVKFFDQFFNCFENFGTW
jgi:hypothetical protein